MEKIQKIYGGKIEIKLDTGKDGKKHIYYVDGQRIKNSATGVTGIIDKSGALMGWAIKLMALYLIDKIEKGSIITEEIILEAKKKYREAKQEAADIGTAIHEWIENWIKEKKDIVIPDNEKIANGITAFLKWQAEQKMKFNQKDSERLVFSKKYWYVGTLDAIATIKGKKVLIDFKSSNGIYNEYHYQVASYWNAYEEEFGETFDHALIVRFNKETGEFNPEENIVKITREEYNKDIKAFLGALAIKERENELKG